MRLYRFSPITSQHELFDAITYTHLACYKLCRHAIGRYLPNAGNIGIFCHYDDEYQTLTELRKKLTHPSDNPDQKYFELIEPIVIPATGDVPETTYTHLYIRRPDIYRAQVGDVDFYLDQQEYDAMKANLAAGAMVPGARIFPRDDIDMIELFNPDIDALGYISTNDMTKKVHLKQSDETNL